MLILALGQTTIEAVLDIIKREGFFGLYSGLNSSLLGIAVTNGYVPPSFLVHDPLHPLLHVVAPF